MPFLSCHFGSNTKHCVFILYTLVVNSMKTRFAPKSIFATLSDNHYEVSPEEAYILFYQVKRTKNCSSWFNQHLKLQQASSVYWQLCSKRAQDPHQKRYKFASHCPSEVNIFQKWCNWQIVYYWRTLCCSN